MDYQKIYNSIMDRAKSRCLSEYNERHHIVPCFMYKEGARAGRYGYIEGNYDDPSNIVRLTPREHILAHKILVKIVPRKMVYSAVSALVYLCRLKGTSNCDTSIINTRKIEASIAQGRRALSTQYRGTVIVKNANTGEMIGRVSKTHPKYLSGEYVFYQKGTIKSEEYRKKRSRPGKTNANFNGVEDVVYIKSHLECALDLGFNPSKDVWIAYCVKNKKPLIKCAKSRFNGKGWLMLYEETEKSTGMKYDPYFTRRNPKIVKKVEHKWL